MPYSLDINFSTHIQDSVSVGDIAYYVFSDALGGFNINADSIVMIGEITAVDRINNVLTCNTDLAADALAQGAVPGGQGPFIMFAKSNCHESNSILGYYGLFKFKNTSIDKAELFHVTVDVFESSK